MRPYLVFLLFCGGAFAEAVDALSKLAALTDAEWLQVQRGAPVAKILPPRHERELAASGVIRIPVSRAAFLERFRDIESFKRSPAVQQIVKLSSPPALQDFANLQLESGDLQALRECDLGHCRVKVPTRVIARLAREPIARNFGPRATSIVREELLRAVESYLKQGDSGLIQYHDKQNPVPLSDQFQELLSSWTELNELAPELPDRLAGAPDAGGGLEQFLYWSKENFGIKPVISITHTFLYELPDQTWIASKQIYASHYFDASLSITLVMDDPAGEDGQGAYVAYVNRSRIDLLGGFFDGWKRGMVRQRVLEGMEKSLRHMLAALGSDEGNGT